MKKIATLAALAVVTATLRPAWHQSDPLDRSN
ncbi:MAG: hypothetical protein GAK40_00573 [Burkholderia plantarii]|nr:MAG: hypothetical protein GAK40_00573 [Burkholderia plantarii]